MPSQPIETFTYTVVIDRDPAGGFVATCPALDGVVTEGNTVEETLGMVRDAIRGYLESLRKDGIEIPKERESIVSPIQVAISMV